MTIYRASRGAEKGPAAPGNNQRGRRMGGRANPE